MPKRVISFGFTGCWISVFNKTTVFKLLIMFQLTLPLKWTFQKKHRPLFACCSVGPKILQKILSITNIGFQNHKSPKLLDQLFLQRLNGQLHIWTKIINQKHMDHDPWVGIRIVEIGQEISLILINPDFQIHISRYLLAWLPPSG